MRLMMLVSLLVVVIAAPVMAFHQPGAPVEKPNTLLRRVVYYFVDGQPVLEVSAYTLREKKENYINVHASCEMAPAAATAVSKFGDVASSALSNNDKHLANVMYHPRIRPLRELMGHIAEKILPTLMASGCIPETTGRIKSHTLYAR